MMAQGLVLRVAAGSESVTATLFVLLSGAQVQAFQTEPMPG